MSNAKKLLKGLEKKYVVNAVLSPVVMIGEVIMEVIIPFVMAKIIDVGISKLPDGSIKGDVRSDELEGLATAVTPVPGGVGPMTVAMLMENTVKAAELHQEMNP